MTEITTVALSKKEHLDLYLKRKVAESERPDVPTSPACGISQGFLNFHCSDFSLLHTYLLFKKFLIGN